MTLLTLPSLKLTLAFPLVVASVFVVSVAGGIEKPAFITRAPGGGYLVSGSVEFVESPRSLAVARLLESGRLDPTFGFEGRSVFDFSAESLTEVRHAVDQKKRVIVTCRVSVREQIGIRYYAVAVRFNENGSLDSGFADGGVFRYDAGAFPEFLLAVEAPEGRLVLVGESAVIRLNEDGTPDATFGTDGVGPIGNNVRGLENALLLQDGRILVSSRFSGMFVINTEGVVDPGFANPRSQLLSTYHVLCQQIDGKIVVAEATWASFGERTRFARFHLSGSLDTDFGTNGFFEPARRFYPLQLVPSKEGGIVGIASGSYSPESGANSWIYRLNSDGSPNVGFGLVDSRGRRADLEDASGIFGDRLLSAFPDQNGEFALASKEVLSAADGIRFTKLLSNGELDPSAAGQGSVFFRISFPKPLLSYFPIDRELGLAGEYRVPVSRGLKTYRAKAHRAKRFYFHAAECGAGKNDYVLKFDAEKGQVTGTLGHGGRGNTSRHPFFLVMSTDRTNARVSELLAYRTASFVLHLRPSRFGEGTSIASVKLSAIDESGNSSLKLRIVNPNSQRERAVNPFRPFVSRPE